LSKFIKDSINLHMQKI